MSTAPSFFLKELPKVVRNVNLGYISEVEDQFSANSLPGEKSGICRCKLYERFLKDEWRGYGLEKVRATIVVPIHNEQKSLESSVLNLLMSQIPSSAKLDILFITNACTDNSISILDNIFSKLNFKNTAPTPIENETVKGLQATIRRIEKNNYIRLIHIDTPVPGKGNALNIANEWSVLKRKRFCMNIDANSYVLPETVREMLTQARYQFNDKKDGLVLTSGKTVEEYRNFLRGVHFTYDAKEDNDSIAYDLTPGAMMCWHVGWLKRVGGFATDLLSEDWDIALKAATSQREYRKTGHPIVSYAARGIKDRLNTWIRYKRAALQLRERYENHEKAKYILDLNGVLIKDKKNYLSNLKDLIVKSYEYFVFLPSIKGDIDKKVYLINRADRYKDLQYAFREIVILPIASLVAKIRFKKQPYAANWTPIRSTK